MTDLALRQGLLTRGLLDYLANSTRGGLFRLRGGSSAELLMKDLSSLKRGELPPGLSGILTFSPLIAPSSDPLEQLLMTLCARLAPEEAREHERRFAGLLSAHRSGSAGATAGMVPRLRSALTELLMRLCRGEGRLVLLIADLDLLSPQEESRLMRGLRQLHDGQLPLWILFPATRDPVLLAEAELRCPRLEPQQVFAWLQRELVAVQELMERRFGPLSAQQLCAAATLPELFRPRSLEFMFASVQLLARLCHQHDQHLTMSESSWAWLILMTLSSPSALSLRNPDCPLPSELPERELTDHPDLQALRVLWRAYCPQWQESAELSTLRQLLVKCGL